MPRIPLIALLLFAYPLLQSCERSTAGESEAAAHVDGDSIRFARAETPPAVDVGTVAAGGPHTLALAGRVVWDEDRTTRVFSPLAGRVASINVKPGDEVKRGQPLAVLDSPDYGAAQSDFRKAAAVRKLADATLARAKELFAHGVIAEKDLQQAETDAVSAAADAERAERLLQQFRDDGKSIDQHMVLRSPVDGVVVERNLNPGQELRPDQSTAPLFVVTDPHRVWIELDAGEQDLAGLKPGLDVSVRKGLDGTDVFKATVFRVSDFVDPQTRTIKVLATAANDSGLLKGETYVTATLQVESLPQPRVAAASVYLLGNRHYAFVKDGDAFVRREVRIGREHDGLVDVLSGLNAGEAVVTHGALFLQQTLQRTQG